MMAETYRTEASPRETEAQLLWPRQSLAGCIFCAIVRDTRGIELSEGQRFNHFPSTPFCTLHWLLDGQGHTISSPEHVVAPVTGAPIPRFSFFGPQQGPSHTWNPGQVRFLTLIIYPEAFALLTGVDLAAQLNRMAPAEQVLPETMLGQLGQFLHPQNAATDCPALFHAVEEHFDTWWRAARPDRHAVTIWLRDWTMSLAARAATSGAGRSVRQVQRRVKSWTGHSIRELQAFGSTETLFAHFGARKIREDIDWARLAAASGFADQSHMTRHVRRRTGFTPAQFGDLVERDETFWFYRLLGERYWSRAAAAELLES
jgi:AraC-like DNA-binding protein